MINQIAYPTFILVAYKRLRSADYASTSCKNLVNFRPVTLKIMRVEILTFDTEKSIFYEYLRKYWTDLKVFTVGRYIYEWE